jgi:hypothetical protein
MTSNPPIYTNILVFKFNFVCVTKPCEHYISNPYYWTGLPSGCLVNSTTKHVTCENVLYAHIIPSDNTKANPSYKSLQYTRSSLVVGSKCINEEPNVSDNVLHSHSQRTVSKTEIYVTKWIHST